MKIALFGYGKMNRLVEKLALADGDTVVLKSSSTKQEGDLNLADVAIDFSSGERVLSHLALCQEKKIPLVIGTTDWDVDAGRQLVNPDGAATLFSPNFSLGVFLFSKIIQQAAKLFEEEPEYQTRGVETHHQHKKDAPSGTALALGQLFKQELPFESIRTGDTFGKHEVIFDSLFDTIHLTHDAHSREGFASGALKVARRLIGKHGWHTLEEVFYDSLYLTPHR